MRKIAIIVLTVAVLIGLTIYFDHATRAHPKASLLVPASKSMGKPAPEIRLEELDGKKVSLSDFKGKVVFVNFWATWCGPCQDEIPSLIDMQNKYVSKGFTVVGIAMDEDPSVVGPFVAKELYDVNGQKLHINYPILLGSDDAAEKFGGILGYPTSFLVSRDGQLLMKFQGPPDLDFVAKAVESSQ